MWRNVGRCRTPPSDVAYVVGSQCRAGVVRHVVLRGDVDEAVGSVEDLIISRTVTEGSGREDNISLFIGEGRCWHVLDRYERVIAIEHWPGREHE